MVFVKKKMRLGLHVENIGGVQVWVKCGWNQTTFGGEQHYGLKLRAKNMAMNVKSWKHLKKGLQLKLWPMWVCVKMEFAPQKIVGVSLNVH